MAVLVLPTLGAVARARSRSSSPRVVRVATSANHVVSDGTYLYIHAAVPSVDGAALLLKVRVSAPKATRTPLPVNASCLGASAHRSHRWARASARLLLVSCTLEELFQSTFA